MAKTLKGRLVYIAATGAVPEAQNSDLNLAGFVALDWVAVANVGSIGESGASTNLPTYDELGTDVIQKGKGITDAGSTPIEVSLNLSDDGQNALRAAALEADDFAISWVDDDGVTHYQRGKVTGPTSPNGRNEDFRRQVFTLGWNQREVIATAADMVAPANTVPPSISASGAPDVSNATVLTAIEGSWDGHPTSYSYQWQQDTAGNNTFVDIGGQTSRTLTTVVGYQGNALRVGVKGTNAAGTTAAFVYSIPTPLVVA
jgi:hypothetical protein